MGYYVPIVQGYGHAIFDNGTKCALYIDKDCNIYATAALIPIDQAVKMWGNYKNNN